MEGDTSGTKDGDWREGECESKEPGTLGQGQAKERA